MGKGEYFSALGKGSALRPFHGNNNETFFRWFLLSGEAGAADSLTETRGQSCPRSNRYESRTVACSARLNWSSTLSCAVFTSASVSVFSALR
jgi:hypothetical protein